MEIIHKHASVTAFIRPEQGANVGLLRTNDGAILIDTTSSPLEIQALLDAVKVGINEVSLVINTHFHSDHTWGNQLFSCSILAHRLCQELMQVHMKEDWSKESLLAELAELERTNPSKADSFRQTMQSLEIRLPDKIFEDRFEAEWGGLRVEAIHMGAHTPDTSIVWLPEHKALFASDLIFQGRYPFIFDADVPAWVAALDRLLEYKAETIIPGHGVLCGKAEIAVLREYLSQSWELTRAHLRSGHGIDETAADPAFPVFPGEKYERLHQANIRLIFEQMVQSLAADD